MTPMPPRPRFSLEEGALGSGIGQPESFRFSVARLNRLHQNVVRMRQAVVADERRTNACYADPQFRMPTRNHHAGRGLNGLPQSCRVRARCRLVTWAETRSPIDVLRGTLIDENVPGCVSRLWWTPEDVPALSPHPYCPEGDKPLLRDVRFRQNALRKAMRNSN